MVETASIIPTGDVLTVGHGASLPYFAKGTNNGQALHPVAVVVFSLVSLLQLLRLLMGWEVTINGSVIPLWASGIACVVAASLAVLVWRERR
jgi:hypothetical protein